MTSGGTLVNFASPAPVLAPHLHVHGFGGGGQIPNNLQQLVGHPHYLQQQPQQQHQARPVEPAVLQQQQHQQQLGMLDLKMSSSSTSSPASSSSSSSSSSSLSPDAPGHILPECYIGMWDSDQMGQPPPTKLETTDIMDLIPPASPDSPTAPVVPSVEPGSTSPTTIIHHTPTSSQPASSLLSLAVSLTSSSSSPPCSQSPQTSSTSPSSASTTSSTASSQYLIPLPSLGDPYGTSNGSDATGCHLLEGFHSPMDPFPKLSDTSHPFQDGGYDAFMSDLSQPPPPHQSTGSSLHSHDTSVLLLDMSGAGPPTGGSLHTSHGGQCSPGCSCQYTNGAPTLLSGSGDPFAGGGPHLHPHHPSHLPHPHELHRHHSTDYSWDDLHTSHHPTPGDYGILFHHRKGESPSTSDSVVSYPDNDSESKCSSTGGGSLTGEHHPHHHHHLSHHVISPQPPVKRKVGRPPKKDKKLKRNEKKTGRLWEFIRDLLKNPDYCPSLVKWENHEEGHFRFVNSEKVAQLWGQIKGNPRMTYEKLSRAMRYYYKSHVFEPVLGRRLVYKFGYNATNWKPINPNFTGTAGAHHHPSHSSHHSHHHHHHDAHLPHNHPHHPTHPFQHPTKMYN